MALLYDYGNLITGNCLLTIEHYTDGSSPKGTETAVLLDGLQSKQDNLIAQDYIFPNVYSVSSTNPSEKYLSNPTKVIGIKPKKLVIADDGLAFYTDSDVLAYKNINRVVTIDLEEFVIESVQSTKATFDSELSDYLETAIKISPIASGGTVVTNVPTGAYCYYYAGSAQGWLPVDVEDDQYYGNIHLAVKPGE